MRCSRSYLLRRCGGTTLFGYRLGAANQERGLRKLLPNRAGEEFGRKEARTRPGARARSSRGLWKSGNERKF
jgi:hypothetical protein